jgi:hypothetical protein
MVLAGVFANGLDLGDASVVADGRAGVFVARLGPDLRTLWLRTLYPASQMNCELDDRFIPDVSVSRSGNIALAGPLCGKMDLGGGELLGSDYLLLLGPDGSHRLSRGVAAMVESVAATDDGGMVAAGHYLGQLYLGDRIEGDPGERGAFIARWASSGELLWSRRVVVDNASSAVRITEEGDAVWLLMHEESIELDGVPLGSGARRHASLAKIRTSGEVAWAVELGAIQLESARARQLALGRDGRASGACSLAAANSRWRRAAIAARSSSQAHRPPGSPWLESGWRTRGRRCSQPRSRPDRRSALRDDLSAIE